MDWNAATPLQDARTAMRPGRPLQGGISPAQWAGKTIPSRRWIVEGLIPVGSVTMISGDGGLGKSLLGMQLIAACATGRDWLGMSAEPCLAVGLHCEDDEAELHRRMAAIAEAEGFDLADLDQAHLFSRAGADNALFTVPHMQGAELNATAVFTGLSNFAIDHGARLIVLDSLHDLFPGNENIRPQVRAFVTELRALAMEIDGAVVLLAHPSAAGLSTGSGTSGSTAWNNAVRSRLYLTRPPDGDDDAGDPDARQLRTMKANYGAAGGVIRLRYRDGVFVRTDSEGFTGVVAGIQMQNTDKEFLRRLDALYLQGRYCTDSKQSPHYAPKILAGMQGGPRVTRREMSMAMERLLAAGKIRVGQHRKANRHLVDALIRSDHEGN
jgi:RecA-family ATPase